MALYRVFALYSSLPVEHREDFASYRETILEDMSKMGIDISASNAAHLAMDCKEEDIVVLKLKYPCLTCLPM